MHGFKIDLMGQWRMKKRWTLGQKSQDRVGCVLGWKCTNSPETQLVYYRPLTKEVGQLISVVGGGCGSVSAGELSSMAVIWEEEAVVDTSCILCQH